MSRRKRTEEEKLERRRSNVVMNVFNHECCFTCKRFKIATRGTMELQGWKCGYLKHFWSWEECPFLPYFKTGSCYRPSGINIATAPVREIMDRREDE